MKHRDRPRNPCSRRTLGTALLLCAGLALGACSSESGESGESANSKESRKSSDSAPQLRVTGAYVPQPTMADMAAGFLVIHNAGAKQDKLTSVTSEVSETVEIHETVDQQMRQVKSLPVPANGKLELNRGGNHLMFLDLHQKPKKGDKVTVTLHFATSDPVKLSVPVKATNHQPAK